MTKREQLIWAIHIGELSDKYPRLTDQPYDAQDRFESWRLDWLAVTEGRTPADVANGSYVCLLHKGWEYCVDLGDYEKAQNLIEEYIAAYAYTFESEDRSSRPVLDGRLVATLLLQSRFKEACAVLDRDIPNSKRGDRKNVALTYLYYIRIFVEFQDRNAPYPTEFTDSFLRIFEIGRPRECLKRGQKRPVTRDDVAAALDGDRDGSTLTGTGQITVRYYVDTIDTTDTSL